MGSFAETYNDAKSGGRELNLARKAQGFIIIIIIIKEVIIQEVPPLITMFYNVMGKLVKQKPMLEM